MVYYELMLAGSEVGTRCVVLKFKCATKYEHYYGAKINDYANCVQKELYNKKKRKKS